jgi:hypothetical protein
MISKWKLSLILICTWFSNTPFHIHVRAHVPLIIIPCLNRGQDSYNFIGFLKSRRFCLFTSEFTLLVHTSSNSSFFSFYDIELRDIFESTAFNIFPYIKILINTQLPTDRLSLRLFTPRDPLFSQPEWLWASILQNLTDHLLHWGDSLLHLKITWGAGKGLCVLRLDVWVGSSLHEYSCHSDLRIMDKSNLLDYSSRKWDSERLHVLPWS